MGWTSTFYDKRQGLRSFFEKEFNGENEHGIWRVVDFAALKRGQECYAALYHKNKETGAEGVHGMVILCKFSNDEYYNLTYKDMGEEAGPYCHNCPERILNILTPLAPEDDPSGWARAWRQGCREALAVRKGNRGRFKVGDTLTFKTPLRFTDGVQRDTFTVSSTKPLRFKSGYFTVRITRAALNAPGAFTITRA